MKDKFEEIYEELCQKSSDTLQEAKYKRNKNILITIAVCIIVSILVALFAEEKTSLMFVICISLMVIFLVIHRELIKYRKLYKNRVITKIVKKCYENLEFLPDGKLSKNDYRLSKFDNTFDELYSEDMITGRILEKNNFQMAQISTKEVSKTIDDDGNVQTEKTETFKGIYGIVKLEKSSNAKIYIANNSITKKYSANRIEMDSVEFEKEYDCLTEDKITAMKIFTSDLLEKLIDLKKAKLTYFELKVEGNMIYFRSRCGEVFEPPKFKDALEKELIKKYYDIIVLPVILIEEIIKKIEEL